MFTVGEFARLAQVSKRLLRYYDEIGLLKPVQTDRFTGYRFYSVEQLPELNRILALKDLGLSLEQIQRVLRDNISTDEIQGMLLMKKAEIEQQLVDDVRRIRNIESRLQAIRDAETNKPLDVVIKQIPAQPVLSVRTVVETFESGIGIFGQIVAALPARNTGPYFSIWHSGGPYEPDSDVEIGCMIAEKSHAPIPINDDLQLGFRELPAVETMATFVVTGGLENMHSGYGAIGTWAEVNGYRFADAPREIFLQISQPPGGSDSITEIQYPLEPVRQS
ncbi:MAG: MerR family transcriptional regulator [Chloroflexi bacterium]|nr:MerR family transcriptional regulator [Chloroflexota bacterium]